MASGTSSDDRPGRRPGTWRLTGLFAGIALIIATAAGVVSAAEPSATSRTAEPRHRACAEAWRAAADESSVDTLRALGNCEIDRRLQTLDRLDARVGGSKQFTDRHKTQLQDINDVNPASYEAERVGLRSLRAQINSETDLADLRELIGNIAEDFRVYLLVVPKTHLVGGADGTDRVVDRLTAVAERLEGHIDRAEAAGKDVTEARRLLADMRDKVGKADALAAPVAGSIMPLSPADWNAGTAGPAFRRARTTLAEAREQVWGARADALKIVEILRA
jgi:hypothetical protein